MNKVISFVINRYLSRSKGFTIVEVLVVVSILGVIGYMVSDIIARSLQGSQRTLVIGTAKQNGQVALDSITQAIRNSDLVVCIGNLIPNPIGSTTGDILALYSQDGRYVRLRYDATRQAIVQDLPQVTFLVNNLNLPARVCDTDPVNGVAVNNETILTDIGPTNGVLIQKVVDPIAGTLPFFEVKRRPGSNDSVTVQFEVRPRSGGGNLANQLGGTGGVQFYETVQLR